MIAGEANVGRGSAGRQLLLFGVVGALVLVGVLRFCRRVVVPSGTIRRHAVIQFRMIAVVVVLVVRFAGGIIRLNCPKQIE